MEDRDSTLIYFPTDKEIFAEAYAFVYFYLPVLHPGMKMGELHIVNVARDWFLHSGNDQLCRNVFVSKVGRIVRAENYTNDPYIAQVWDTRLEHDLNGYHQHVREVRCRPEELQVQLDTDCCNCHLWCMPDTEPAPQVSGSVQLATIPNT